MTSPLPEPIPRPRRCRSRWHGRPAVDGAGLGRRAPNLPQRAEIRACLAGGTIAAILHMEGAEAIGPDLDALHALHAMGLRSLGPVWSRPTVFGHGVPFRFPASPTPGRG